MVVFPRLLPARLHCFLAAVSCVDTRDCHSGRPHTASFGRWHEVSRTVARVPKGKRPRYLRRPRRAMTRSIDVTVFGSEAGLALAALSSPVAW
jgi:hypothetical protein